MSNEVKNIGNNLITPGTVYVWSNTRKTGRQTVPKSMSIKLFSRSDTVLVTLVDYNCCVRLRIIKNSPVSEKSVRISTKGSKGKSEKPSLGNRTSNSFPISFTQVPSFTFL